ncbi:DDE-1 domain-containing protein [Trichonephila clavata]|uniref:DDE-1 domain-containing protein n=1 Tax=Trichonephila clavata TaxID=2740835 RepID=A0A8X6KR47_TRICU|nr:DDE-1 domain-containing protein [Trichonephila clavata]
MLKGAPPGTVGTAHISKWSNAKMFVEFLKHFISYVKCSVNQQVLLLLDNHKSHVSIESNPLTKEHGIVMLTFPPHTSHKLQPLDRGVFGPFKNTAVQHVVI